MTKAHIHLTLVIGYWTFLLIPAFAQTAFDPLTIGSGARALGMGKAQVASAPDAVFGNPAALGEIDFIKFTSMTGQLLEDANYTLLGGVFPLGRQSAFGLGYAGSFVTGIEIRDRAGTFSRKANYGNSVIVAVLGKQLTEKLSLGASLKYYFTDGTEIDSADGRGWNGDLGLLQTGPPWLKLGLVIGNFATPSKINYQGGHQESFPVTLKTGGEIYLLGEGYNSALPAPFEIKIALDSRLVLGKAKPVTLHSGLEFSPHPLLTLRGGLDENNFTTGLSLKLLGAGFHYAYHPLGQYFSLTFDERGWPPEDPLYPHLGRIDKTPEDI